MRWMCMQELQWAREANVAIQGVVHFLDKPNIGDLLGGPCNFWLQRGAALKKCIGAREIVHVDRTDERNLRTNVQNILDAMDGGKKPWDILGPWESGQDDGDTDTAAVAPVKKLGCIEVPPRNPMWTNTRPKLLQDLCQKLVAADATASGGMVP